MPVIAAEVTLNGASCFPVGSPPGKPFEAVIKEINDAGKGQVQVKLVGGAPAIGSPFTLTQRMSKGAYDLVGCTEAYFGNVLPEAPAFRLAERSYAALRKNGGIPYMQKLLAAKGVHYIGRHHDFGPFHLWLSKPIDSPDLTGLHLRVSPVYTAFFKSMGATVQTSNIAQVYTYMENGTVQGYGWPALGWVPSWVKVTKYRVEPGFYNSTLHTLANLKKWNTLTAAQKAVITKVVMGFEARSEPDSAYLREGLKKQNAKTASEGLSAITFTGANAKTWVDAANDAAWTEVRNRSPQDGPKLQKLFEK
jgi:TRAP-type C4-dicarboxylate transport system substrate-binding protein